MESHKERALSISAVIMTKNEENNIRKCLESLRHFEEVFVVDSGSADLTCDIARKSGARVVEFAWNGRYPKKKQWCLENLPFSHDWVLYVDADEEVTPELADEIRELITAGPPLAGYFVGYDYLFLGRVLTHGQRAYKLVLFNRHKGRFVDYDDLDAANMWEVEGHYQPRIDGPVGTLEHRMLHTDHDSLFHYFERHNRYSDWEAVVRAKNAYVGAHESQLGTRGRLKTAFDAMPGKALAAFVYSYVVKGGFLDGRAGLHFALAKAFYYWQIGLKVDELKERQGRQRHG
jgi:glycosyltransferase involved in cell wall biosynthesis